MLTSTYIARLGSIALVASICIKSSAAGWRRWEGETCENQNDENDPGKYVGMERCGGDKATRLRCQQVEEKYNWTTTFDGKNKNKCEGDKPLCKSDWDEWSDENANLKTECIAGVPPQGFDDVEGGWACPAVEISSKYTGDYSYLSRCDPSGKWFFTCRPDGMQAGEVEEFLKAVKCGAKKGEKDTPAECKPLGYLKGRDDCSEPVGSPQEAFP